MRQLKFRVYDSLTRTMNMLDPCAGAFESGELVSEDWWQVMQFTGLKDKNGVEIYEGDIVVDHVGTGEVKYSDKHAAFRVVYGDGYAKWFHDYNVKGERESIEVIGNIHQNPELLT